MFERYTENARRAIYFARTEALARNSTEIGTKDILLGLTYKVHQEGGPFTMLHTRRDELRALMGPPPIEKLPEARDIPLARESKIALAYAAEEANRDRRFSLEPDHLLRGIVRGGDSTAIALTSLGWDIETLRALSKESQRLFPPKRPPLRRILKSYSRRLIPYRTQLIKLAVFFAVIATIIFYLRWQQR